MKLTKAVTKRFGFGALMLVLTLTAIGTRHPTQANTFNCQSQTCPNSASCDGDYYSGGCQIQCWKNEGNGHIIPLGSSNCGSGPEY
jgi:hypothetical protein